MILCSIKNNRKKLNVTFFYCILGNVKYLAIAVDLFVITFYPDCFTNCPKFTVKSVANKEMKSYLFFFYLRPAD